MGHVVSLSELWVAVFWPVIKKLATCFRRSPANLQPKKSAKHWPNAKEILNGAFCLQLEVEDGRAKLVFANET